MTDSPIPMRLHCPGVVPDGHGGQKICGALHIDEGEFATKPHHTHSCQHCGLTWRPAVVHTVGVRFLPGFKNTHPNEKPAVTPEEIRLPFFVNGSELVYTTPRHHTLEFILVHLIQQAGYQWPGDIQRWEFRNSSGKLLPTNEPFDSLLTEGLISANTIPLHLNFVIGSGG